MNLKEENKEKILQLEWDGEKNYQISQMKKYQN